MFSCPADVLPWQGADAVSFATLPPSHFSSLSRNAYRCCLAVIFSLHRAMVWVQSQFNAEAYAQHFCYYHLNTIHDLPTRQLFLYSQSDHLCHFASIERFYSLQRHDRGVTVLARKWEDSPHVEHFRHHAEEYARLCRDFVEPGENEKK